MSIYQRLFRAAISAAIIRTQMKKVHVRREADERTFKTLAPQYATIHLATHGVLDNREPLNSYLLLTKTEDETENDGLLHAREIIDLDLDADLAFTVPLNAAIEDLEAFGTAGLTKIRGSSFNAPVIYV